MARTSFPVIKSDRVLPADLHYATRCYWNCPCGGTVPDAPPHCIKGRYQPRARTNCVDVLICVNGCPHIKECPAYKAFQTRNLLRRIDDQRRSAELEKNQKEGK